MARASSLAILRPTGLAHWRAVLDRGFETMAPYVIIGGLLILWEIASERAWVIPFLLPAPSTVLGRIADDLRSGTLALNIALTLYRTLVGFALAAIVGMVIGVLMLRVAALRWFFDPIVSIGLPMPKIVLLPVLMLWFGLHEESKIVMIMFTGCFQIIVSTWHGIRSIEKELLWSARSLGATEREVWWQIVLPAAMPQILTGLQITLPVCMMVALITEMEMGGGGLGDAMLIAARYARTPGVFAGIIEIGAVGFCLIKGMELVRRRVLAWHPEVMRAEITV